MLGLLRLRFTTNSLKLELVDNSLFCIAKNGTKASNKIACAVFNENKSQKRPSLNSKLHLFKVLRIIWRFDNRTSILTTSKGFLIWSKIWT